MSLQNTLRQLMPDSMKQTLRPIRDIFVKKYGAELSFWKSRHHADGGVFDNAHYKKLMLAVAQENNTNFVREKVIADFGCGPRGSLVWADSASMRIGIDVLADKYADAFTQDIVSHDMVYLKSTENVIPLPSNFVDIMFTLNAIDHVDKFSQMCAELVRVIKPGGELIGSFNLEEAPSASEPQRLSEALIEENLLCEFEIQTYRVTKKGPKEDPYGPFSEEDLSYQPGEEGFLWVRAKKPI